MTKPNREDIHLIRKHSNWSESGISKALQDHVYADKSSWQRFVTYFLLSLGVSFSVLGILFFFAYNWENLHKFFKLGILQFLLISGVLSLFFFSKKSLTQKIILAALSLLVGVLYAVFGQVYQTGANAYDFFLGWTLFITIWVIVSNFHVLWLIYLGLVNITLVLFLEQVANHWPENLGVILLILINLCFLVLFLGLPKLVSLKQYPSWLTNCLALWIVSVSAFSIIKGIGGSTDAHYPYLVVLSLLLYGIGFWYGLKKKKSFYLALIPFSVIVIVSAFLLEQSDSAGMFLTVGLFIVVAVSLLVRFLIKFQRND